MKLQTAIVASIIALGLCVGAWATSWYKVVDTNGSSITTYKFYWEQFGVSDKDGNTQVHKYDDDSVFAKQLPEIKAMFAQILAFLTAGAAALLFIVIFQGLRQFTKMGRGSSMCRIIGVIVSVGAMVVLAIAFFSFFNITKAFLQDDWPGCTNLSLGDLANTHRNCDTLMGHDEHTVFTIPQSYQWGPDVGWWLTLAALVVSAFAVGGSLTSKK